MKLWIARDDNNDLWVYVNKPVRFKNYFDTENETDYKMLIDEKSFPEITFENSPQQVELKLCNTDFDRILEENKDVLKRIKENGD